MNKTFKYRIYPNKKQVNILNTWLYLCKDLYNIALEQRIKGYKQGYKVNYKLQQNQLPELKDFDERYQNIYAQVLQQVLKRLDTSFINFFRRHKSGTGYPRFKNKDNFRSLTFPQYSKLKLEDNKIFICKQLDFIKIKYHRTIEGTIKTLSIKKTLTNKWYITLSCENIISKDKIKQIKTSIGIDLGVRSFLTTSNNTKIENPRFLNKSLNRLKTLNQSLSSKKKGSNNYYKAKNLLTILHEKISNQRTNFLHKLSNKLINLYDLICYEDLKSKQMLSNDKKNKNVFNKHSLNRSIVDVSWNQFILMLNHKAEKAGTYTQEINPRNTSKTCSICSCINDNLKLSDIYFKCPNCKVTLDRDYNASLNILRLGTSLFRSQNHNIVFNNDSDSKKLYSFSLE